MQPPSPRPGTSPRPKKKFSLRSLRSRFASTSNLHEGLELAAEWNKVSPHSTITPFIPDEVTQSYFPGAGARTPDVPSPSSSSQNSHREKILPPVPNPPPRPPVIILPSAHEHVNDAPREQTNSASGLPWVAQFPPGGHSQLYNVEPQYEPPSMELAEPVEIVAENDASTLIPHHASHIVAAHAVVSVIEAFDVGSTMHHMKGGVNNLPVEIPGLLNVLDEVAKIHVSISVVVLAFKAAYNMERTRRENDKRILLLYVAMKDMLSVLVQLRNIQDPYHIGPDGHPMQPRLESLSRQAAQDIKECANTCDTYLKKTLVVKVLRSQAWETRLASFTGVFAQRKRDFEFALTIHTANTVDSMNSAVQEMNEKITELTSMVVELYRREWTPSNESQLARKVKERGGPKFVENNDTVLSELALMDNNDPGQNSSGIPQARSVKEATFTLQDLKDELHEDWESAIQKNMETFEGKFALYQRQLQEELSRLIREENNRLVDELTKGPHDKIKDDELRAIWKEMDWKLNVKARLFVMTLRDHYRDKADSVAMSFNPGATSDDWAFEFINAKYLQPIMEAFDDDGSGYVTYQEVNEFVDARPPELDWSLPHWVAYWAVGFQATSAKYGERILELFDHLFSIRSSLLPENRFWADYYLKSVWPVAFELIKSFHPANVPEHIEAKFKDYAEYEENRIRKNLQDIRFDIDALDTVYVVAGPGRIEKYLFPLIYLLLQRDVEVFHVAKRKVLHKEELLDSADSLLWVFRAVQYRYLDLSALFKQNHLNVDSQMKIISGGLFEFMHNPATFWTWRNLQSSGSETENVHELDFDRFDSDSTAILNYPLKDDHRFKCELYENEPPMDTAVCEADANAVLPVRILLGEWNGYIFDDAQFPSQLMMSFRIHANPSDSGAFNASGMHDGVKFDISGRCRQDLNGVITVNFSVWYAREFSTQFFSGYLDESGSLVGTEGWDEDETLHDKRFIFKRHPARRFLRFRPSPAELEANKPRALWKFAINCALHHVQRQNWSWDYIRERRETRIRYIELSIKYSAYGHCPNETELAEWTNLKRHVAPIDASFYRILREHQLKTIPSHDSSCRGCGGKIGGSRVICLDCLSSETEAKTVDFCDNPVCAQATLALSIKDLEKRHLPSHDLLKTRTVLHLRDVTKIAETGVNALAVARDCFQTSNADPQTAERRSFLANGLLDDAVEDTLASYYDDTEYVPDVSNVECRICQQPLYQPCWYCLDCFANEEQTYICDDCETKTLLRCAHCDRPYKQPSWYYGSHTLDNFLCNTCTAWRVEPPPFDRDKQHTYLHQLVRCTRKADTSTKATERSMEERMSTLEQIMWSLTGKVGRVEETMGRIERLLLANLAGNKDLANGIASVTACARCQSSAG